MNKELSFEEKCRTLEYYDNLFPTPVDKKQRFAVYAKRREAFKKDLFEYLGIVGHDKAEKLFELAWERRHSDGYYAVMQEADELVELLA